MVMGAGVALPCFPNRWGFARRLRRMRRLRSKSGLGGGRAAGLMLTDADIAQSANRIPRQR